MDNTAAKKRENYFRENPLVYELYQQVKTINENQLGVMDKHLEMIKQYAIEHTLFYRGYKLEDTFPIMTKLDFIKNQDAITSDEIFDRPLHVTSTSGSTGVPFSVKQNYEKRMRTIAELKVFGEYAK